MNGNSLNYDKLPEFDNHRLIHTIYDQKTGLKGFIAIHRGGFEKPAFGATRIWAYKSESDAIKDALELSRVMTYKSAMAGLYYGGAKAVLIDPKISSNRTQLLKAYMRYINYLNGHFITGADVGVNHKDIEIMAAYSKYIVGIRSDPVKYTVLGVYYAIGVCLKEIFGSDSIEGKTFAIQGLGKTGEGLLDLLYSKAGKIYVTDINRKRIKDIKTRYPAVEVVKLDEIYRQKVDVFSPCALSYAINYDTVTDLQCPIITGSANSQLENVHIGDLLYKLGILYAPDYIVNAGGLITVVDEYENGKNTKEKIISRVQKIKQTLRTVITRSKKEKRGTHRIANELAEKIFRRFA